MKRQEFNPDNVLMHEQKDGTIPKKYNKLILKEVVENSKIMQLGIYEPMDDKEKEFQYFAKGPGAYWVGEGQKIKTTKAQWLTVKMTAKKLGVIMLCSREYLQYTMSEFFKEMSPKIAEAFWIKFDLAGLLGVENPFPMSIEKSVTDSDNVIIGPLDYDNIVDLQDKLEENDFEANAFVSNRKNRKELRGASKKIGETTQFIYDRDSDKIDGLPVVNIKDMLKGDLYAGDFDYLRYGIPFPISYKMSEEAQISTITNEDGTPVNLYEQELVALRVTMDVGLMVIKDDAFAKIQAAETPAEG